MNSIVGQNFQRVDAQEKVTGRGIFTVDMKFPGMIYAKALRSPFPHARITSINTKKAESLHGVITVLTRENLSIPELYYGAYLKDQPIVALDKVRYSGDIVAAVAAVDEGIAEDALKSIDVEYEELPAVLTLDEALKSDEVLVHQKLNRRDPIHGKGASVLQHKNSNIGLHFRYQRGNVRKGFQEADYVLEDTFDFPSAYHYAMEPHASIANYDHGILTVWSSTQSPFPTRQELARLFGLPLSCVRVIVPYVGGGYGSKSGIKMEALVGVLSKMSRRPVKIVLRTDESFNTICQPSTRLKIKTGVRKNGTIVARKCEVHINGGAYANSGPSIAEKVAYRAHGPYRIPNVLTDSYHIYTNTVPAGAFRGFGGPQTAYAYESHLDMIAHHINIDPLEIRIKNLLKKGEDYAAGDTPMDCDLKKGLKKVAKYIGWGKKLKSRKETRFKRGIGIACGVKDGGGTNKAAHAMVKVLLDGSVLLSLGSVEIGQGIRTALMQVVSDELSVPPEKVLVADLDTQHTPFDKGTNASSAVSVMGQAVLIAAQDARKQFLFAAAAALGSNWTMVRLNNGKASYGKKSCSFREIMQIQFGEVDGEIIGKGYYKSPRNKNVPLGFTSPFWEVGMAGAEIEVDEITGSIQILRYVSLTDSGKMINPILCRGQDEGATVLGLGQTLSEELHYKDGKLINSNLVDYRVPRFRDLPDRFQTHILEEKGGPGPQGAKGVGEGGVLAVAPAICNAFYNATGVRVHRVPLLTERVVEALKKNNIPTS